LLAADAHEGKLRLWEVRAAREYRTLVRDPVLGRGFYSRCAVSPDGRLLAISMQDGLGLWDLQTGAALAFTSEVGMTDSVWFEPSGNLLTGGAESVFRWPFRPDPKAPGGVRLGAPQRLPVPGSEWTGIAGSAGRPVLAFGQPWGALVVHPDRPDQPVRLERHPDVRYVSVSRGGDWVATGSHNGTGAKVWEVGSGKLVKVLLDQDGFMKVAFSPDGKWLATSGGGCRLWAVPSWQEGPRIGGELLAFSPDGQLVAVETGKGAVRLVEPDSGREYARLEDPNQDRAGDAAFSPDGTQLVLTNRDSQSVHVWDLRAIRAELVEMDLDWAPPQ
jgi:WD40 repeat protein